MPGILPPIGGLIDLGSPGPLDGSTGYNLTESQSMTKRNTDVTIMSNDAGIIINLKGLNMLTLNINVLAPEYQTDLGFKINDHLALDPPSLELQGTLTDEWDTTATGEMGRVEDRSTLAAKLRKLRGLREAFIVKCDFGWYEGMVFEDLNISESDSSINSFKFSATIKQTIKASILLSKVEFLFDSETNTLIGTYTQNGSVSEITLTAYEAVSEQDRSILEKIWDVVT